MFKFCVKKRRIKCSKWFSWAEAGSPGLSAADIEAEQFSVVGASCALGDAQQHPRLCPLDVIIPTPRFRHQNVSRHCHVPREVGKTTPVEKQWGQVTGGAPGPKGIVRAMFGADLQFRILLLGERRTQ